MIHSRKKWKQPKCPTNDEQINKIWNIIQPQKEMKYCYMLHTNINESWKHYA